MLNKVSVPTLQCLFGVKQVRGCLGLMIITLFLWCVKIVVDDGGTFYDNGCVETEQ